MNKYYNPERTTWTSITQRPSIDITELFEIVRPIINAVSNDGDKALLDYEEKFDKVRLQSLEVTEEELQNATRAVQDDALLDAIRIAKDNITRFHEAQRFQSLEVETRPGVRCWQKSVAIERVGLYVPGGSAPLFSTVLMLAIPAMIAGCKEVILCSPPDSKGEINPVILYTAQLCGVKRIFKLGGAQAIAAMARGTESIPRVDKIFGPGNRFVMAAKQLVSLQGVAIDMPAGPSEVEVIADNTCNAQFVAADLLSQAEHGPDSQVVLVCTNADIAKAVESEIARQLQALPRKEVAEKSLEGSRIIIFDAADSTKQIIDFTNAYGPEHLIIATANAHDIANNISAAGSIFLGTYACESAGDYASGTNHTLPTMGYARAYSGLSLDSFCRKMTLQEIDADGIRQIGQCVVKMAEAEGLEGHANAMRLRINSLDE